jgi:hypothetical protein
MAFGHLALSIPRACHRCFSTLSERPRYIRADERNGRGAFLTPAPQARLPSLKSERLRYRFGEFGNPSKGSVPDRP